MRATETHPPERTPQRGADDSKPLSPLIDGREDVRTRGEMLKYKHWVRTRWCVGNERCRVACAAWGIDPSELDYLDALQVAERLHVRLAWLLTGDEPMLFLDQMTGAQQVAERQRPGSENLPGYCLPGAVGPWKRDELGEWTVDRTWNRHNAQGRE